MSKTISTTVKINNKLGLHARPVTIFVETASQYDADVRVRRCDQDETVDGKSIMQMMMLAATQGTEVEISASGEDADKAVNALVKLVESRFQED